MALLKRIFGGASGADDSPPPAEDDPADAEATERAYELEVARSEQDRLDDLKRRQLRYADYAWQPPRQGGDRRADDGEKRDEG